MSLKNYKRTTKRELTITFKLPIMTNEQNIIGK